MRTNFYAIKEASKIQIKTQISTLYMRKKTVAANWKMNEDYQQGIALFAEVVALVKKEITGDQRIIVCPPFINLHILAELSKQCAAISIGAQNANQAESGAFTGEISAKMIQSTGAEYLLLGHSERRLYFFETNKIIAEKIDVALANQLKPIYCVGETKQEREANQQFDVLKKQLDEGIFHLNQGQFLQATIAYEPIWAIGTGVTASAAQAQEIHHFIRSRIADRYDRETADNTTILYGGSCTVENAGVLFSQPDIDGGLIGRESLKARDFVDIVKIYNP